MTEAAKAALPARAVRRDRVSMEFSKTGMGKIESTTQLIEPRDVRVVPESRISAP